MRYGIPLLANRVSPRCTIAEGLLVLEVDGTALTEQWVVPLSATNWTELLQVLQGECIDTLVCGGIANDAKAELLALEIEVIENVAETAEATVTAILHHRLRPGFGFDTDEGPEPSRPTPPAATGGLDCDTCTAREGIDCLACTDHRCLRGEPCLEGVHLGPATTAPDAQQMLEAALDITCEEERNLCRLAEIVYFALEMKYKRLGVAYCWDLAEPARILVGVLRRFFEVVPVGCKIGGRLRSDLTPAEESPDSLERPGDITCNPQGQAEALNRAGCDFNVCVGLCLGADCVFASASEAPVTTLLVKDRSLAHNPIGALYSDYYLKEATRPARARN